MIITNTIKKLAAAGVSLEAIIIAVETIEAEMDARRLATTERVRKHRALRNVTQRNETETPPPQVSLSPITPIPSSPSTPSEPNGSVSERRSDARKPRVRREYGVGFLKFWDAYPTDSNMSKYEASQAWARLSPEDQEGAIESLPSFLDYCQANPDYRPIHANRYLLKRRFEGHRQSAQKKAEWAQIRLGDQSWEAWRTHYRDAGRRFYVKMMDEKASRGESFGVPSLWPPGHVQAACNFGGNSSGQDQASNRRTQD